ncbi:MAG TPA: acetolactate decarboxylase [Polyangiaceae bacterium]|jgi:acetolactate decarboxylase|nr:acetolactate decarboxylase [Polyangiaceae bacterium]
MREPWVVLAMLVVGACTPSGAASPTGVSPGQGETRVFGALRALMHEGKTGPQVALSSVVPGPHAHAVGALSELRGEVTVLDDDIWLAYPNDDGTARVTKVRVSNEQAALLVTAQVGAWRRIPIAAEVRADRLDEEIERLARANGVDVARPIPLLVEGEFADIGWHVVDGRKIAAAKTHEEHAAAAVRGSVGRATGTLVGFFSTHHQGVFTHMNKNTHFHVVLPKENVAAHVDGVTILPGATLLVPQ